MLEKLKASGRDIVLAGVAAFAAALAVAMPAEVTLPGLKAAAVAALYAAGRAVVGALAAKFAKE